MIDPIIDLLRPVPTWADIETRLLHAGVTDFATAKIANLCLPQGEGWLAQFEGTPLLQKALELAQAELEMEVADLERRDQREAEGDADRQRWRQRDELGLARKALELELVRSRSGAAEPTAPAEPPTDPRESTVKVETKPAAPKPAPAAPPATPASPAPADAPGMEAKVAAIGTYEQLCQAVKGRSILAKGTNAEGTLDFPDAALGDGPGRRATPEERRGLKAMPDATTKDPEKKADVTEDRPHLLPEVLPFGSTYVGYRRAPEGQRLEGAVRGALGGTAGGILGSLPGTALAQLGAHTGHLPLVLAGQGLGLAGSVFGGAEGTHLATRGLLRRHAPATDGTDPVEDPRKTASIPHARKDPDGHYTDDPAGDTGRRLADLVRRHADHSEREKKADEYPTFANREEAVRALSTVGHDPDKKEFYAEQHGVRTPLGSSRSMAPAVMAALGAPAGALAGAGLGAEYVRTPVGMAAGGILGALAGGGLGYAHGKGMAERTFVPRMLEASQRHHLSPKDQAAAEAAAAYIDDLDSRERFAKKAGVGSGELGRRVGAAVGGEDLPPYPVVPEYEQLPWHAKLRTGGGAAAGIGLGLAGTQMIASRLGSGHAALAALPLVGGGGILGTLLARKTLSPEQRQALDAQTESDFRHEHAHLGGLSPEEVGWGAKKANVAASLLSGMARRPMMPVAAVRGAATAEGHALSSLVGRRPPPMPTSAVRPGASPFMPAPGASAQFAGTVPGPAPNLGPSRVPTGTPAPDAVEYFKRFGGSAPAAAGPRAPAPAVAIAPMSHFKLAARRMLAALGGAASSPF